jgi:hypothetical protein
MDSHAMKAISTADRILEMVQDTLRPLEFLIGRWPAEFRAIIWEAVAASATRHAEEARRLK